MNLKELRESKKLSQGELAKRAGMAQSSISHIEQGTKNPSIVTIKKLAAALEIPVIELLD